MIPLKDTIPSRTVPVVNYMLIIINAVIFLFEVSLPARELQALIQTFGVIPHKFIYLGQIDAPFLIRIYPLFTSMFLHGGWFHIVGNMWFLWIFGDNVEDRMGHVRYFFFYIISGVGAALAHIFLTPQSTAPTIGASGAIAGVMGAYFILYPQARVITMIIIFFFIDIIEVPAFLFLGVWFILQFFQGTFSLMAGPSAGGVAWWAHFGGFLIGASLVFLFKRPKHKVANTYADQYFPW